MKCIQCEKTISRSASVDVHVCGECLWWSVVRAGHGRCTRCQCGIGPKEPYGVLDQIGLRCIGCVTDDLLTTNERGVVRHQPIPEIDLGFFSPPKSSPAELIVLPTRKRGVVRLTAQG